MNEKTGKSWRVKRRHWCHLIGLEFDSLFQKTPVIIPKKRTVHPGDAFENTAFQPVFEIVKFRPRCRVSALYFFYE
jgi:hypothetical protein